VGGWGPKSRVPLSGSGEKKKLNGSKRNHFPLRRNQSGLEEKRWIRQTVAREPQEALKENVTPESRAPEQQDAFIPWPGREVVPLNPQKKR